MSEKYNLGIPDNIQIRIVEKRIKKGVKKVRYIVVSDANHLNKFCDSCILQDTPNIANNVIDNVCVINQINPRLNDEQEWDIKGANHDCLIFSIAMEIRKRLKDVKKKEADDNEVDDISSEIFQITNSINNDISRYTLEALNQIIQNRVFILIEEEEEEMEEEGKETKDEEWTIIDMTDIEF